MAGCRGQSCWSWGLSLLQAPGGPQAPSCALEAPPAPKGSPPDRRTLCTLGPNLGLTQKVGSQFPLHRGFTSGTGPAWKGTQGTGPHKRPCSGRACGHRLTLGPTAPDSLPFSTCVCWFHGEPPTTRCGHSEPSGKPEVQPHAFTSLTLFFDQFI